MHRCHGISTDIDRTATRAVTKVKATITQRFNLDGIEADAESDCRFCFIWVKVKDEWKAMFVRHWYEKVGTGSVVFSTPKEHALMVTIGRANPSQPEQDASS